MILRVKDFKTKRNFSFFKIPLLLIIIFHLIIKKFLNKKIFLLPNKRLFYYEFNHNGRNNYSIGLTILLPYIISTRSNWKHCKMRIFALTNPKHDISAQEKE